MEPCTVGLWIARRAGIQPGDRVAVIGCGTVGLMAVQTARFFGADRVVAASRSPFKLDLAKKMGADTLINLSEQAVAEAAHTVTNGSGVQRGDRGHRRGGRGNPGLAYCCAARPGRHHRRFRKRAAGRLILTRSCPRS